MLGSSEIIVIVIAIMVLFGASAIPKFAKSLGKAKAEFEKGIKEGIQNAEKKEEEKKEEDVKKE